MKNFGVFLTILLFGVVSPISAWRTFLRGRSKYGLGVPFSTKEDQLPQEQWLQQNLDHFNPMDARTWEQVTKKYTLRTLQIFADLEKFGYIFFYKIENL